jgi:hypothetical protein
VIRASVSGRVDQRTFASSAYMTLTSSRSEGCCWGAAGLSLALPRPEPSALEGGARAWSADLTAAVLASRGPLI